MIARELRNALIIAAVSWLFAGVVRADSLNGAFARGNRAFARGEYDSAIKEYETLIQAGIDDPDLSFNLASAYGSLGRYGSAIQHFEHGLRLSPNDEAAQKELEVARSALAERQAQQTGEGIVAPRATLGEALFSRLPLNAWSWLLFFGTSVASVCAVLLLRVRSEQARLSLGITGAAMGTLAFVAGLGLGTMTGWGKIEGRAVVVSNQAPLRDGPDPGALLRGELPEGTLVRILAHEGAYVRVKDESREGFVLAADIGEI